MNEYQPHFAGCLAIVNHGDSDYCDCDIKLADVWEDGWNAGANYQALEESWGPKIEEYQAACSPEANPYRKDRTSPPFLTRRYCAICGEPEGSYYAKKCCTDDQMIED